MKYRRPVAGCCDQKQGPCHGHKEMKPSVLHPGGSSGEADCGGWRHWGVDIGNKMTTKSTGDPVIER